VENFKKEAKSGYDHWIKIMIFITETECVYSIVWTESLYTVQVNLVFKVTRISFSHRKRVRSAASLM
jgi:hypothetical protein